MITVPTPHQKLDSSYFGYFYGMGSGLKNESNPYGLTWRAPNVTEDFTNKYENFGAKICVRHRPFGETGVDEMDLDQAVTIKNDEEWSWLIDQYHTETAKLLDRCPDAIVIDYYGKVEKQLKQRLNDGKYSQLLHRLWGSVQPSMNHKVWIAFDAASGQDYPDGSIFHHFVEMVAACKRHQGCDIVVEALPKLKSNPPHSDWAGSEWTRNQHALCLERFYQHRIGKADTWRFTSDTKTTFRTANGHSRAAWDNMKSEGVNPIEDYLTSCMENGHTPVTAMPGYEFSDIANMWNSMQ